MAERKTKERCVAKTEHRLQRNKKDTRADKVLKGAVEIEECLGRHRDCKERVVQGGQWTKAGLGTTRRNSGDHPSRVNMVSGGQGLNTGILSRKHPAIAPTWKVPALKAIVGQHLSLEALSEAQQPWGSRLL